MGFEQHIANKDKRYKLKHGIEIGNTKLKVKID